MTSLTAPPPTHEDSGPPILGDTASFPSFAEQARTLAHGGAVAALATITNDGFPYTSMVPISVDDAGSPIVCVSELAEHTRNLRRTRRASVLVGSQHVADGIDPLASARSTYVGTFEPFEPTPVDLDRHLRAHPHAADYVGFEDFGWWRMRVGRLRYVGGFGVMGWATATELAAATPDPIVPAAGPMVEHLNDDHADASRLIVEHLGGVETATDARVTDVDRYGITFDVDGDFEPHPQAVVRIAFAAPLTAPDQVREATVDLVRRARRIAGEESGR